VQLADLLQLEVFPPVPTAPAAQDSQIDEEIRNADRLPWMPQPEKQPEKPLVQPLPPP